MKKAVKEHNAILSFENSFKSAFDGFDDYLHNELIEKMNILNISKTESVLSENVFERLNNIQLVDRYEAYQLLDDDWAKIAVDLEIIQTEGIDSARKVDPNMVIKKKDGREQEVQEGWTGRIIPFGLVQEAFLADDKNALKEKEKRLVEIATEYEELFDSLTEEEKEGDFAGEESFINAEVKKAVKSDEIEPETKEKLCIVNALIEEEKALKAAIKKEQGVLESKTKKTIENLSDEQVIELLHDKWITPLIQKLTELPDGIVNGFVLKLDTIAKKYETTFSEIESQISDTEAELRGMIDNLEGNELDMLGLGEFKKLLGGM